MLLLVRFVLTISILADVRGVSVRGAIVQYQKNSKMNTGRTIQTWQKHEGSFKYYVITLRG